jgi:ring-1,2-phenylacetyl-CoA epoxidase subunit PaaD
MVIAMAAPDLAQADNSAALQARAWEVAASVVDPEIPVLSIADLGVLRDVRVVDGTVEVDITPTYSGCPAMNLIALNVEMALIGAGFPMPRIKTVLSPAWTTDWMTDHGKEVLAAYGIAPPEGKASRRALFGEEYVTCPRCHSRETNGFPNSARPPARRCGAARPAPSHSITSNASDANMTTIEFHRLRLLTCGARRPTRSRSHSRCRRACARLIASTPASI